jgi:hypothetical protein
LNAARQPISIVDIAEDVEPRGTGSNAGQLKSGYWELSWKPDFVVGDQESLAPPRFVSSVGRAAWERGALWNNDIPKVDANYISWGTSAIFDVELDRGSSANLVHHRARLHMRHLYEGALTPFKVLRLAQGDPKQEPRKNSDDYVRPFNVPKSYQIAFVGFSVACYVLATVVRGANIALLLCRLPGIVLLGGLLISR